MKHGAFIRATGGGRGWSVAGVWLGRGWAWLGVAGRGESDWHDEALELGGG